MSSNIGFNDLVEFTESCTALGAIKCRANNIPGKVVSISENINGRTTYSVDAGLGYWIYAGVNDIRPFKSSVKKEEIKVDKEREVCKV